MKKKTAVLVALVAALGVIALLVSKIHGQHSTFKQDFHVQAAAMPGMVTKVFMADKENHSLLLETADGVEWTVDGQYKADRHMVKLLMETLSRMRVRSKVNNAAVGNVTTIMAGKSTKVEVYYKDYRIDWFKGRFKLFPHQRCKVFYVGYDTQDNLATYMYREGDDVPCIVYIPGFRGCLSPRFVVDQYAWRSHSIVDISGRNIALVEMEIPSMPEESFSLVREGDGFVFNLLHPMHRVDGFDSARVGQLLSSFTHLNFDEYARAVPQAELDSSFSGTPRTILRVADVNGNSRELKTFIKYVNPEDALAMPDTTMYQVFDLNRLYAVIDNTDTVLIQYYVFDNILQPASFFLGKDKSNFAR